MVSNKRIVWITLLLLITSYFSISNFILPVPDSQSSSGFSAKRVSDDIKIISKEPHSSEHPAERERVRSFLAERLREIGFDVEVEYYDSIGNIYASLPPLYSVSGEEPTYVLLMAHLDSRHANIINGKTHYSKGAADDGYGLGVILELAKGVVKYRDDWSQGVKILFTDAEETNLGGIKMAVAKRGDFLSDVGFIINIEARGVKGPALLFETSPGNSKLVNLYSKARFPAGYSLTSFVYNILPNYSDFSLIKEEYSGINIAVIDNLDYYHTEMDSFENISLSSIQHYGEQLTPILKSYLKENRYSDINYLRSSTDSVYFTLPLFGIVIFSAIGYNTLNVIVLLCFVFNFIYLLKTNKIGIFNVLKTIIKLLIVLFFVVAFSWTGSWLIALINGASYKLIGLAHLRFDEVFSIICLILTFLLIIMTFKKIIKDNIYRLKEYIISSELILLVSSIIIFSITGENFFLLFPLIFSLISRALKGYKFELVTTVFLVVLLLFIVIPFIYSLYIALYTGSIFIPLAIFTLLLFSILPALYSVSTKLA